MSGSPRCVRVLVRGRVQGVCFRQSTADRARVAGVAGWVRNLPDGRVEARLQGDAGAVDGVLDWIRSGGPPAARVDEVAVAPDQPVPDLDDFDVRP